MRRGLIIGEPARPVVVEPVRRSIANHAGDVEIRDLRTLHLGLESILVFLEVELSSLRDPRQLGDAHGRLTDELQRAIPAIQDVFLALPRTGPRRARRRSR